MAVDRADRAERVGHELGELQVDHLVGRDDTGRPHVHRPVEPVDDVPGELLRRLGDRRVVAGELAEVGDQRADGRDDAERVAVRLHEERVRVLGEQRVEAPDVAGRLQDPARRRMTGLQVLEERPVPPVRGRHVGLVQQPVPVRRDVVLGGEDHRAEVGAGDAHALLGQAGAHRVHGAETGQDEVHHRERLVHLRDASVGVVGGGFGWRHGPVHLPGRGDPGRRIERRRSCRIVVPVRP